MTSRQFQQTASTVSHNNMVGHGSNGSGAPSSSALSADAMALRHYVTAQDGCSAASLGRQETTVLVDISHSNLQQRHLEQRLDAKSDTIADLRQRIYQNTGTPPGDQHLKIYHAEQQVADLPPGCGQERLLGYFLPATTSITTTPRLSVHCLDVNPDSVSARGALENTALVKKYEMSDEVYNQRSNTVRKYKQEEQRKKKQEQEQQDPDLYGPESVANIVVGDRCQVQPGNRRGRVAFVGTVDPRGSGVPSYWVGVVLDEPVGQNDGSVNGIRYFETPGPKYGALVRGCHVETGSQFVPLDDFLLESSDDEEDGRDGDGATPAEKEEDDEL